MEGGSASLFGEVPHKGQHFTFPLPANDVATTVPLIPMKIAGWQLPTDNYRSSGPVAAPSLSMEIASCCLRAQEMVFN